jgi:hypothetical protein
MAIFLAATLGMCAFVVCWALGMSADVGALIALLFVLVGIGIHMLIPADDRTSNY